MPRPWDNLSDYEFEGLVGDLFGAALGRRFERFARGPDIGIDLRHLNRGDLGPDVIQAKHYKGSAYSDLKRAVRKEVERVARLDPQPGSYRLVTSQGLTVARKAELAELLAPWVERADHVVGRDDLEQLLDEHPEVERRHVKLWLAGGTQLAALLRAGTHARSRVLAEEIRRTLPLYVQSDSFFEAHQPLRQRHVILISGPPGIGKTTLARMLLADAIAQGFEPIEISGDIAEAWDVWDASTPQAFLYDDFLGRTVLGELAKNEESRLLSFMRAVSESPQTLLVLTTREYILQQAALLFEAFRRHALPQERFMLVLDSYSRLDRARILHNHVWHSELPPQAKEQLAHDRAYRSLVLHRNFNPRTIEFITGLQKGNPLRLVPDQSWLEFAEASLERPEEIWRQAFEQELGDIERALLLCMTTLPAETHIDDLHRAFDAWCERAGLSVRPRRFERALQVVDDTFVSTRMREGRHLFVRILNPGLTDFLNRQLLAEASLIRLALQAAIFIEQPQTVWQLLQDARDPLRRELLAESSFSEAVSRGLDESGAQWGLVVGFGKEEMERRSIEIEQRLVWAVRTCQTREPPAGLIEVVETRLQRAVAQWQDGQGSEAAAVGLARRLRRSGPPRAPRGWRQALKSLMTAHLFYAQAWGALADYIDLFPHLFSAPERAQLGQNFLAFCQDQLGPSLYDIPVVEELDELAALAERFGVELDEADVDAARDSLAEHLSDDERARDWFEDQRFQEWKDFERPAELAEEREMDALFGRLADG